MAKFPEISKFFRNSEKFNFLLNLFLWFRINYSRNWECFDQSCVNRPETVHGTLRFLYLSHLLYGICMSENLPYESVYFKELHNEPTVYRAGAAVVSTITSLFFYKTLTLWLWSLPESARAIWSTVFHSFNQIRLDWDNTWAIQSL